MIDIINDLKEFLSFDNNGIEPIRANGTRWVTHKPCAMKVVISKYGAYTHHLATLSVDPSVKGSDRAKQGDIIHSGLMQNIFWDVHCL